MTLRVILGSDEAGVDYKDQVLADLRQDPRVGEVVDIGVNRASGLYDASVAPGDEVNPKS